MYRFTEQWIDTEETREFATACLQLLDRLQSALSVCLRLDASVQAGEV